MAKRKLNEEIGWVTCPPELQARIFSFLSVQDLGRASQVCHDWRRLADTDLIWSPLFRRTWRTALASERWETACPVCLIRRNYFETFIAWMKHLVVFHDLRAALKPLHTLMRRQKERAACLKGTSDYKLLFLRMQKTRNIQINYSTLGFIFRTVHVLEVCRRNGIVISPAPTPAPENHVVISWRC